jgi:hypothetical protein
MGIAKPDFGDPGLLDTCAGWDRVDIMVRNKLGIYFMI